MAKSATPNIKTKVMLPVDREGSKVGIVMLTGKVKIGSTQTIHASQLNLNTIDAITLKPVTTNKYLISASVAFPGSPDNFASVTIGSIGVIDGTVSFHDIGTPRVSLQFEAWGH